ncbi:MAG: hypothetical protein AB4290_02430 [Spirulina sp.]
MSETRAKIFQELIEIPESEHLRIREIGIAEVLTQKIEFQASSLSGRY